jgi:hypothetical protein
MGNPMTPLFVQQPQAIPFLGSNIASATPSASGSADLISAATNTSGIIITSVSLSVSENTSGDANVSLKVDGNIILFVKANKGSDISPGNSATMGIVQIPANQAVSYSCSINTAGSAQIYVTWKAAGSL